MSDVQVLKLNCGTLYPPGGKPIWKVSHFVCRCLVITWRDRLIAVDTGIGLLDIERPVQRLTQEWINRVNPALDPAETLVRQIASRGIDPHDVTDVILTHHHRDHAGGLADLPWVRVHATLACRKAVLEGDQRVSPPQWEHDVKWAETPQPWRPWRGRNAYTLPDLPETIRLIDLPGHAPGHAGVLLEAGGFGGVDLLHVGDAIYHRDTLTDSAPPAVEAFAVQTQSDGTSRAKTEAAVGALQNVQVMTSHDPRG